ncbi:MAG: MYXO-CTERM sorting domain-containing protein [Polyangiaceae bacterium]
MMRATSLLLGAAALAAALGASCTARAITRTEALVRARAFAYHPWRMGPANATASCNAAYKSVYAPGDYLGLPYDWGGYMSLFTFDQQIASGYGAGSYPADGILDCTAGLDCSGFVSQCWQAGHYTTSSVDQISSVIAQNAMLAGDIYNDAGNHMAMHSHLLGSGEPALYESVFYNVHYSLPGWSWLNGFVPRRYTNISGSSAAQPDGTTDKPIVIGSLPFVDSRNTAQSLSDVLDGCAASPSTKETGPEYIYQVAITQPGKLTVSVQDDVGVDIDVHLYTSMNTNDCVARDDTTLTTQVDCGTYYVVADTFASASGSYAGQYSLSVTFQPTGGSCGSGPPKYAFKGGLGSPCAYPGNQSLPFCNPNLGADSCLYTQTSSFCSAPCATDADCSALSGGCCRSIGNGEKFCVPAAQCGGGPTDAGVTPKPDSGDPVDAGPGSAGFAGAGAGPGTAGSGAFGASSGTGAGTGFGGFGALSSGGGSSAPLQAGDDGGCATTGRSSSGGGWIALLGLVALFRRRRVC